MRNWVIIIGLLLLLSCGEVGKSSKYAEVLSDSLCASDAADSLNVSENSDSLEVGAGYSESTADMDEVASTAGDDVALAEEESELLIDDKTVLKNGCRAIRIFARAPMNEMVWWVGKANKPLIVYSRASECDAQILTFMYNSKGKIDHVKEDVVSSDYDCVNDVRKFDRVFSDLHRKGRHQSISKGGYNEYKFEYDSSGRLVAIKQTNTSTDDDATTQVKLIRASKGNHLAGDFRPGVRFWTSDLNGGRMNLYCYEVPNKSGRSTYSAGRWVNFYPVTRVEVEKGKIKSGVAYRSIYPGDEVKLAGSLDIGAETEILNEEEAWDEEFGTPIDFVNPPEMPEEYKFYPKAVCF